VEWSTGMAKASTIADNKGHKETRAISCGQNNNYGLTGRKVHQNMNVVFNRELRLRKDQ
jgi:hypothetical protein